jgi:hypothetical protein
MMRLAILHLALGCAAALALVITCPIVTPLPGIDSGIFLYVGQQILHGAVPYRDLWENKPPAIYYIDALGLALGHGSRWGLCLVEWFSLWAAASMGFTALSRVFGKASALFASFCWVAAFARSLQGGNFPEEFALPLQFASLIAFVRLATIGISIRDSLLLGFLGALALTFKPNAIGLWVAIGLWSLVSSWRDRDWMRSIVLAIGGTLGVCIALIPLALFLIRRHALDAMIDQAIHYNLIYSAPTTWTDRLWCAIADFRYAAPSGLAFVVLGSWTLALYLIICTRRQLSPTISNFLTLAIIALPLETLLACTTGDIYFHHFIPPLPCWAILIAFAGWIATGDVDLGAVGSFAFGPLQRRAALVAIVLLAWFAAGLATWKAARDPDQSRSAALRYISSNTAADDFVLTWGLTAALDFASARREPSRFFHEFPLSTRGYTGPREISLFLGDLERNPPLLIVDSSAQSHRLPPFDARDRALWLKDAMDPWRLQLNQLLIPVFTFVESNYRESYSDSATRWKVYRRIRHE